MQPFAMLMLALFLWSDSGLQKASEVIQLSFSAEDGQVHNPSSLPPPVLKALAMDDGVRQQLGSRLLPPPEWFSATKLTPVSAHEDLYLVEAEDQLRGANVTSFWLIRNDTVSAHAKTMWTDAAHDVQLCYGKKKVYPDISAVKFTAERSWDAVFRFREDHYAVAYERQGELGTDVPLPYCPFQPH